MTHTQDPDLLRRSVRDAYAQVAIDPRAIIGSYGGRPLAVKLGYPTDLLDTFPEEAVESFAGVHNPFSLRPLTHGDKVVDVGSGAGFDVFIAAHAVGETGRVLGVDMTPEMLTKAQRTATALDLPQVEFREGMAEDLPVEDGWADVVISNGVLNLCDDKATVIAEIHRVLRPGGALQFADVATGRPVPAAAACDLDLRAFCLGGGLTLTAWQELLEHAGFTNLTISAPFDNFASTPGEEQARNFDVHGYAFVAFKAA